MKNKIIKKIVLSITAIILIISIILLYENKKVTIIQLSPQGSRQMMGYIIKNKDKLIVIDGGTIDDTENLINQINKNGGKVDYWFLTHAHDDHVGAFAKIINETNLQVNKVYASLNDFSWYEENEPVRAEFTKEFLQTLNSERIKDKVEEPQINQTIEIASNIKAEILGIKNPEITENPGNEQSMVIKFYLNNKTLLILGDTGVNSSNKLLNSQKDKLKSDIVQMAHHGQAGATEELYQEIKPQICLWPTPEWLWNNDAGEGFNTGQWKTIETREWMEKLKVKQNCIAKDGDITIFI